MAKKKNPEQEAPPVEEQDPETTVEQEETPPQEEQPQEQEPEDQEDQEEPEDEEENPQEEPEQQPGAPAQEQPATDENAKLRSDLLQAQGKLAAYAAGVAPGMVDDAVTLAMAEAAKSGDVTEATVTKALDAVLKRHPEWKASGTDKPKGGFRLGADRDSGGSKKPSGNNNSVKRWNRFK